MIQYNLTTWLHYLGVDLAKKSTSFELLLLENPTLSHLRIDSRQVGLNDVFIALKGLNVNGESFIPQALAAGAKLVLVEAEQAEQNCVLNELVSPNGQIVPQVSIYQLSDKLSRFADDFYGSPSTKLLVAGVTGTNGKTTVSQLIAQWADLLSVTSAVLGTVGNGLYHHVVESANTTSSSVDIQSYLSDFYHQQAKLVAMEVSSHGLALNRVKALSFAVTLFTNLSRDHLDFHQTMENYQCAKWSLFSENATESAVANSGKRIINYDDSVGKQWLAKLNNAVAVSMNAANLSTLQQQDQQYVCATNIHYHDKGATVFFDSSWGNGCLVSQLFGEFNVSNLLMAFGAMLSLDFSLDSLMKSASQLVPICGRMEVFSAIQKPTVIVDYAHTPDALEKALIAVKHHCAGRVWVMFGCGGDRDRGKRPLMAEIAEKLADVVIVTNDNPRTEDEMMIIHDIVQGLNQPEKAHVITNRFEAMKYAVSHAAIEDIILVAGKGHEDYQIVGKTKHHYSDRETASVLLGASV